jgi:FkbM family methyltransferase
MKFRPTLFYRIRRAIGRAWCLLVARSGLQKWHRAMYIAALKGMGVRNFDHEGILTGERHFAEQFRRTAPSSAMIFDVGANTGDYADMIRSLMPDADVLCFEPNADTFHLLHERFAADKKVQTVNAALGAERKRSHLFFDASATASRLATLYPEAAGSGAASLEIDVLTLDDVAREMGIQQIHLLKIDTEGHELSVFAGARHMIDAGHVDIIQFEFNSIHVHSRTFLRDIRQKLPGFIFFRLLPNGGVLLDHSDVIFEEIFGFQNIIAVKNGHPLLQHYQPHRSQ